MILMGQHEKPSKGSGRRRIGVHAAVGGSSHSPEEERKLQVARRAEQLKQKRRKALGKIEALQAEIEAD